MKILTVCYCMLKSNSLNKFENDIKCLAELYFEFNGMNLQLQGVDLNLIRTKAIISAFIPKRTSFKQDLGRGEFCQLRY
ncbi:hypothetical protein M513_00863 [Trichuris suis]|uniref:Uncharacterized protein n=1 Tax=Trichuris suis TaxID=68888 RepID=A0A085MLK4_9BILA|nr:hypothetical protein M513_00863 [Trichuris suis]